MTAEMRARIAAALHREHCEFFPTLQSGHSPFSPPTYGRWDCQREADAALEAAASAPSVTRLREKVVAFLSVTPEHAEGDMGAAIHAAMRYVLAVIDSLDPHAAEREQARERVRFYLTPEQIEAAKRELGNPGNRAEAYAFACMDTMVALLRGAALDRLAEPPAGSET
jgi:hypothetical protein